MLPWVSILARDDRQDLVSVLLHCLKSHLMLAMIRVQWTRHTSGMTWYTRKALGRDSWAVMTQAPPTRWYKSHSCPKSATQHSWAFALSPAHIKEHRQHRWWHACEQPRERWSARAASQSPRVGWETGGCTSYVTVQWLHTHTQSSRRHVTWCSTPPLKRSGFLVYLQLSGSNREPTADRYI